MSEETVVPLLRVGALLDVGIARDRQEDCLGYADTYGCPPFAALALEKGALFVLSDGAGGHQAGDVASELAVSSTLTTYYAQVGGEPEETLVEARDAEALAAELDALRESDRPTWRAVVGRFMRARWGSEDAATRAGANPLLADGPDAERFAAAVVEGAA